MWVNTVLNVSVKSVCRKFDRCIFLSQQEKITTDGSQTANHWHLVMVLVDGYSTDVHGNGIV